MAKNEELDNANTGAPAADIPDLKKKDKERKKAGAAWGGAKPGAGSFSGATGGSVARAAASAAGAAGSAGGAAAAAGAAGGFSFSSFLAGLMATMAGKMAIAAAAFLLLAGGAMVAAGFLKGGAGAGDGAIGDLGSLSSNMKVRSGGNDRTGYVASNGEIMFDPAKPAAKPAVEKAPEDAPPAGDAANPLTPQPEENKDAGFNRPGLEHNLSGSKLSSSIGGGFGGKNVFGGNNAASKLGAEMGKFNIKGGEKGRLSATKAASRTGKVTSGATRRGMQANRAFGQLKAGAHNSMLGAGASTAEGARSGAAAAFDGQNLDGGNVTGGPGTSPTGTVDTPSTVGGAPDLTGGPEAPTGNIQDMGAITAGAISAIAQMAQAAAKMKMMGLALIVVGLALVAAGCTIWTAWLIPIGLAIAAMGYMMVQQSEKMKAMADQMSNQLAARTTDQRQNKINQYCIDKAYREGSSPDNCNPPSDLTGEEKFKEVEQNGHANNERIINEDGRVEGDNGGPTP